MPLRSGKSTSGNQLAEQPEDEEAQTTRTSCTMASEANAKTKADDSKFDEILKELRDFRRDNKEQLTAMREDINAIGGRMDEAEERIEAVESRVESTEELLLALAKLHAEAEVQISNLEGHSRRQNIRIYRVEEGAEDGASSVVGFIESLLVTGLGLPPLPMLAIDRAHRALAAKPKVGAPPRSFVVKFASYRTKDDILKKAWQIKGFDFRGKRVFLDNGYAPDVQRRRKEYNGAKAALRENNIRFQTPFPSKMRVFYSSGTVTYTSAHEATEDMAKRGIAVTVAKKPVSLLEQIKQLTRQTVGNKEKGSDAAHKQGFKERLRAFRHPDDTTA